MKETKYLLALLRFHSLGFNVPNVLVPNNCLVIGSIETNV